MSNFIHVSTENATDAKALSNAATIEVNSTGKQPLIQNTSEKKGGDKFVGALDGKVRELDASIGKETNNLSTKVDKKVESPTNSFYKKNGEPAVSFDSNMGSESAFINKKGEDVYGPLQKNSSDITESARGLSSSLGNSFEKRTVDHLNLAADGRIPAVSATGTNLTVETSSSKSSTNNQPNLQKDILSAHGYSGAVPSTPSIPSVSVNSLGASSASGASSAHGYSGAVPTIPSIPSVSVNALGASGASSAHGYSGAVPTIPSIPSVSVNALGASGASGASSTHGYSGAVPTIPINASVASSTMTAEMQAKTSIARETGDLLGQSNQPRAVGALPSQVGKYNAAGTMIK